jgi:hypothetical protein
MADVYSKQNDNEKAMKYYKITLALNKNFNQSVALFKTILAYIMDIICMNWEKSIILWLYRKKTK